MITILRSRAVSSFLGAILLACLLIANAGLLHAQGPTPAGGQSIATSPLGTAFTYQGYLRRGGAVVSDTCQMQFTLYDAEAGSQIGQTLHRTVTAAGGTFTVDLDFGAAAFTGDGRWLGIVVGCPADNGATVDLGRQALTAAPYAIYALTSGSAAALQGNPVTTTAPSTGQVLNWNGSSWVPQNEQTGNDWHLGGNAGTTGGTDFLGTTDGQPVDLRVGNLRAFRLEPSTNGPNVIGGWFENSVAQGTGSATIGGGGGNGPNQVTADYGVVGGGQRNTAGGLGASVGGGIFNRAGGQLATIGGGNYNVASATNAFVGGGYSNTAAFDYSFVGGGYQNTAYNQYTTIGGGNANTAAGWQSFVGGGSNNLSQGMFSAVTGGYSNTAGYAGAVAGGYQNRAVDYASIGGGYGNGADGTFATVAGGNGNAATTGSSVGGGQYNSAQGQLSTISGGSTNTTTNYYASVGGGYQNLAGYVATVSGGLSNKANSTYAAVGGGASNSASGFASTIPGGYQNAADGSYSLAAGWNARALHDGSFVWADSTSLPISTTARDQFIARASGGFFMYSNAAATSGSTLAGGSGSWSSLSDRSMKANFQPVDGQEVLARLATVPVNTWNYTSQDASIRHIGPVAQDLYAAFGVGEDDRHISTVDADGVALAAIQGLDAKAANQADRIAALEAHTARLEARLTALESGQPGAATAVPAATAAGAGLLALSGLVIGLVLGRRGRR